MPSRQADGDPLGAGLDPPVGLVEAGPDGDPLDPVGVLDPPPVVGLAGEPVLGWADGLVDGFLPPVAALVPVAPAVAALLGPAAPPGADVRDAPVAPCDGVWPVAVAPVVAVPAGDWFAAGVSLNAPETSSATRPAAATAATPAAITPARLRWFGCDWSGSPRPGGPGGTAGRDMRGGTVHSSET
jgi:hypothetical protein